MRGRKTRIEATERQAVAYTRVSRCEQVENGHSLEAQDRRLRAYAEGTGKALHDVYCDAGISAGSLKRPDLQRLLTAVRDGSISAVLVTKLDRLSRNLGDLLTLVKLFEKHDVTLVSASESIDTSTAAGQMMLQLLGVFAQFERGRASERIKDVLGDRRAQRKSYSRNTPFGYRRDGDRLVENPEQQAALAEARTMHEKGASLRQIAARMTELEVRTNNGGVAWYPRTVQQVLGSLIAQEAAAPACNPI